MVIINVLGLESHLLLAFLFFEEIITGSNFSGFIVFQDISFLCYLKFAFGLSRVQMKGTDLGFDRVRF